MMTQSIVSYDDPKEVVRFIWVWTQDSQDHPQHQDWQLDDPKTERGAALANSLMCATMENNRQSMVALFTLERALYVMNEHDQFNPQLNHESQRGTDFLLELIDVLGNNINGLGDMLKEYLTPPADKNYTVDDQKFDEIMNVALNARSYAQHHQIATELVSELEGTSMKRLPKM